MLQPVLNIFYEDPDEWLNEVIQQTTSEEINVEEEINSQKKDIERFFDAYTSEQVAVQLKDQANGDLKKKKKTSWSRTFPSFKITTENSHRLK